MPEKPTAYCVRCRMVKEMNDPKRVVGKKGKVSLKGFCPECGISMVRFDSSEIMARYPEIAAGSR